MRSGEPSSATSTRSSPGLLTRGGCSSHSTTGPTLLPQLTPVNPNDNDGMYEFLATECTTKILGRPPHHLAPPVWHPRGRQWIRKQRRRAPGFLQPLPEHRHPALPADPVGRVGSALCRQRYRPGLLLQDPEAGRLHRRGCSQGPDGRRAGEGGHRRRTHAADGIQPAVVDEEVAEGAAEAEASYNRADCRRPDILVVKEGVLTKTRCPIQFLQFDDARALFEGQVSLFALASDEVQDAVAELLIDLGEVEDDYELIDELEVDYEREEAFDNLWAFAAFLPPTLPARASRTAISLRSGTPTLPPPPTVRSREFCRKMVSCREGVPQGRHYGRLEPRAVNPGWGPRGANTYDLLASTRVGGSCRHFWQRRTYLKKNNKRVSVKRGQEASSNAAGPQEPKVCPTQRSEGRPSAPAIWSTVGSWNRKTLQPPDKWRTSSSSSPRRSSRRRPPSVGL